MIFLSYFNGSGEACTSAIACSARLTKKGESACLHNQQRRRQRLNHVQNRRNQLSMPESVSRSRKMDSQSFTAVVAQDTVYKQLENSAGNVSDATR